MLLSSILTLLSANAVFLILYISGGGSFPKPLSEEEEKRCLELAGKGDEGARNLLIERNLRLVVHIIKKYYATAQEQEDLISIGTIGLIKAVSTFKPYKGARLATYAARCIENEILMYFRSIRKMGGDMSLNDTIDSDSDGNTLSLIDILSCEESIIDTVDLQSNTLLLYSFLASELTDREKRIITLRYGLGGERSHTQNVIAKRLGISRSYVSRIEKKALLKLRDAFAKHTLKKKT